MEGNVYMINSLDCSTILCIGIKLVLFSFLLTMVWNVIKRIVKINEISNRVDYMINGILLASNIK
jgi:hypothetical protein